MLRPLASRVNVSKGTTIWPLKVTERLEKALCMFSEKYKMGGYADSEFLVASLLIARPRSPAPAPSDDRHSLTVILTLHQRNLHHKLMFVKGRGVSS